MVGIGGNRRSTCMGTEIPPLIDIDVVVLWARLFILVDVLKNVHSIYSIYLILYPLQPVALCPWIDGFR